MYCVFLQKICNFTNIIFKHIFNPWELHILVSSKKSLFSKPVASNLYSSKANGLWEHPARTPVLSQFGSPYEGEQCPVTLTQQVCLCWLQSSSRAVNNCHTPLKDGCLDRWTKVLFYIWIQPQSSSSNV